MKFDLSTQCHFCDWNRPWWSLHAILPNITHCDPTNKNDVLLIWKQSVYSETGLPLVKSCLGWEITGWSREQGRCNRMTLLRDVWITVYGRGDRAWKEQIKCCYLSRHQQAEGMSETSDFKCKKGGYDYICTNSGREVWESGVYHHEKHFTHCSLYDRNYPLCLKLSEKFSEIYASKWVGELGKNRVNFKVTYTLCIWWIK